MTVGRRGGGCGGCDWRGEGVGVTWGGEGMGVTGEES